MYTIRDLDRDRALARGQFDAGTDRRDVTVKLAPPITRDIEVAVSLYPPEGGSSLARDTAEVSVSGDTAFLDGMSVTRVDAEPDAGFNYPYFLYAPTVVEGESGGPVLVEPNNTGSATDDFEKHEEDARLVASRGLSRDISDRLGVPMLVPVFPRPRSDPVDGDHYVHQLDRDTMLLDDGPLERVDLQLLRMVDHARERLAEESFPVGEDIILNGFSASGNFVDRFTLLHPDRVLSVTAGGLNGMAMLPLEEAKGRTLNFHVGVADVEELTGEPFDPEALDEVNQFLYMGSEDANDTIPYTDAWTSDELRETALSVYGEEMIEDRFPYCQTAYERAGIDAQFRVYDGAGHTPRPALEDIVAFHRLSIDGEDVSDFGERLGLRASVRHIPTTPDVGETIEFDATESEPPRGEILAYTWQFEDGETAAGPVVEHAFDQPGEYTVTLTVVDDAGRAAEAETAVRVPVQVTESDPGDDGVADAPENESDVGDGVENRTAEGSREDQTADDSTPNQTGDDSTPNQTGDGSTPNQTADDSTPNQTDDDSTGNRTTDRNTTSDEDSETDDADVGDSETPGFGIEAAVASVGGLAYALDRRVNDDAEE
ncbi:PKD domain-containing protein [Natronoarchaeum mannanilyticum]|uniref:PKD domain-containing protein n=1 Tax=Natronoarchaeum mannanilyticum TaxID=926360 RepID=A0AAV3TD74_9EURY